MNIPEDAVLEAVERIKSGEFKGRAIKVELEAHLDRHWDTDECYDYLMERLQKLGLVDDDDYWVKPLVYARFYNDGSVDSEFTFTLMLTDPKTVLLLPEIIKIWNDLCAIAGNKVDVRGAGMHMAIIQNPRGHYPDYNNITSSDMKCFANFKKSLMLGLPALFFLSTHNETSRRLGCREPRIEAGNAEHGHSKFNAIYYKGRALEFRVFDTCYDNPEAILDNVVVMANCLKYWTAKFTDPKLSKICKRILFGNDTSRKLERLYGSVEHMELLEAGLKLLKPSYRSLQDLYIERNFHLSKEYFLHAEERVREEARLDYEEYVERFEAALDVERKYAATEEFIAKRRATMHSLDSYIARRLQNYQNQSLGTTELKA